jgi:pimeloyl-ACP methyl ester carboxylesterase
VLLLHGQPGSAADWIRVLRAVGDRARAIAIHRPGWDGHSEATDLEGNAQAAIAALDRAGFERATFVGHSFGGGVAAWAAVHHPGRVAALVLLAPSANAASLYAVDRLLATPVVGELTSAATLGAAGLALSAAVLARRAAGRDPDVLLLSSARRMLSTRAWRSFTFEQRALVRDLPALDRDLGAIAAPTTIVCGSSDPVVPPSAQRALATQIPDSRLQLIPRAGHLLPMRQPEQVAEIIVAAAAAGDDASPTVGR